MVSDNAPQQEIELSIQGMTCASCANRIERKLNKLDGVSATVNYATEKAKIVFDQTIDTSVLLDTVSSAGYQAHLPREEKIPNESENDIELTLLRQRVIISALLSIPVIALAMIPSLQFNNWQWLSLTLASPVVVWGAYPFHKAAFINALHGTSTMDTLISIGTIAAFSWSIYALFWGQAGTSGMTHDFTMAMNTTNSSTHIYLEAAAGVTTFILAGRYFEVKSKRKAGEALRALLELGAKTVCVLRDGNEIDVDINELVVNDHFVVRPGEKIATDGIILEGTSSIDSSMMTGESLPVDASIGDSVIGATINKSGRLIIRATRIGADTQLSQMVNLVEEAQNSKAPVQRLADRISGVFVPIVLILSLVTFFYWMLISSEINEAFSNSIAVLIIACPCALGLATPMALMVGTGRGAQLGIIIKGPEILESTKQIDTIVLDKTGTITTGVMSLIESIAEQDENENDILLIAGSLENASEHPIARAIVKTAKERFGELNTVEDFVSHEGLGVSGKVKNSKGKTYSVIAGRPSFLEKESLNISDSLMATINEAERKGYTAVSIGWNKKIRGVLIIADAIKEGGGGGGGGGTMMGLTPILLTGDNAQVAHSVAQDIGILSQNIYSEVLPSGKADIIDRLQAQGKTVAMVGDGVNDAIALTRADLGLAMGTGTDVAIHASDITLVNSDLRVVADAIKLSRATLRTINVNLFWAFAYNIAALPLAVSGLLNPMVAGGAMAFSSIFVVSNSLRLRHFA